MSIEKELVERYGQDVLTVQRRYVPPRIAKDGNQLVVIPNRREKLVEELKCAGSKAHVSRHRVTREVTANYVYTNALPAFAKHARGVLAEIPTRTIKPLYGHRPPREIKRRPFEIGDRVKTHVGWVGTVVQDRGRVFRVREDQSERLLTVHESSMIRIGYQTRVEITP
jgi:hypothetical protein